MKAPIEWGYFDREAGLEESQRFLPHWFQPNVVTFITFRTGDSMPKEIVQHWQAELRAWLRDRGALLAPDEPLPDLKNLPMPLQSEFAKHRDRRWHWRLDSCHGKCELRRRELAEIVLSSLRHFDSQRYDLDCAIVMPNHVHVLVQFRPDTTCREQCEGWLHYTAWQINKRLGRKGAFWQGEPFDHLVRDPEQHQRLRHYIAENGTLANLPETDYLYWQRN